MEINKNWFFGPVPWESSLNCLYLDHNLSDSEATKDFLKIFHTNNLHVFAHFIFLKQTLDD